MKTLTLKTAVIAGLVAVAAPALTLVWGQEAKSEPAPAAQKKKFAPKALVYDKPQSPEVLPGKGLMQHDFLFAGQQAFREKGVQIVRGGKVVWSYNDPEGRGELSDATLLPNGNVLFTHAYGVRIVSPDKKIVWRYDVKREEHEIHGAQAIGSDRVIFVQNGVPTGKVLVANVVTNKIEKEFNLPIGDTSNVHMQMRRLRLTPTGTVIVAHTDLNKVAEYDESGKEVWSAKVERPWSVERLKNGNTLVNLTKMEAVELNPKGETVWSFSKDDAEAQGYIMAAGPNAPGGKWQVATRLANGNTLINNEARWQPGASPENWAPVQALEVSPDKKVVWALRSWTGDTALGSATTIHILDDANMNPKGAHFGSIK